MLLAPTLPAAILETILTGLTALILTGADGDATVARQAIIELLADYDPRTAAELSLAATIVSCGFRSLETLVQAAPKGVPMTQMLRLHASAIGLSREAAKAQRQLLQLQKDRKQTRYAEPAQAQPDPEPAPAPLPAQQAVARPLGPIAQFAKDRGLTWSKAYKQREREMRLAARIKPADAKHAASCTAAPPTPAAPAP